ncbi:NUDIX domain-containing protein [Taibaiella koreensis]|uniref:NUDIX domain-containing protein n=1 Tax=Taibaiella koreensis TaxID=1268548 RepID=UPI001F08D0BA|nr:NUDIX domain-containing protein [Taibaiella koreensis]
MHLLFMKQSAGILLYHYVNKQLYFFLVHPGGPFFAHKDAGWWTIPKGEPMPGEDMQQAALREFEEETGYRPEGELLALTPIVQKGGKKVSCWALEGMLDPAAIVSNTFTLEWPPGSGKTRTWPEIDKAGWYTETEARALINERQEAFIDELLQLLQG